VTRSSFKMRDGWWAHADNCDDMTYMWLSRDGDADERDDSKYFDVMIIAPLSPTEEDLDGASWSGWSEEDKLYYDNPRILIHPPGGDPVLVLSMRGDKLVIVGYDKNHVSFSEGVDYE
jgi:hypothetical protein